MGSIYVLITGLVGLAIGVLTIAQMGKVSMKAYVSVIMSSWGNHMSVYLLGASNIYTIAHMSSSPCAG